jgi:hypothetical protein
MLIALVILLFFCVAAGLLALLLWLVLNAWLPAIFVAAVITIILIAAIIGQPVSTPSTPIFWWGHC